MFQERRRPLGLGSSSMSEVGGTISGMPAPCPPLQHLTSMSNYSRCVGHAQTYYTGRTLALPSHYQANMTLWVSGEIMPCFGRLPPQDLPELLDFPEEGLPE